MPQSTTVKATNGDITIPWLKGRENWEEWSRRMKDLLRREWLLHTIQAPEDRSFDTSGRPIPPGTHLSDQPSLAERSPQMHSKFILSVVRSLDFPKLSGRENYTPWSGRIRAMLRAETVISRSSEPSPQDKELEAEIRKLSEAGLDRFDQLENCCVVFLILCCIHDRQMAQIGKEESRAWVIWEALKRCNS